MILGKIRDIHHSSSPNKLLAYAGLGPAVYQSGNFQAKKPECPSVNLKTADMHLLMQLTMLLKQCYLQGLL